MKRILIITIVLGIGAFSLRAQDTTRVCPVIGDGLYHLSCECGSHYHPHNDYSGLNSLRERLANPTWNGKSPNISTASEQDSDFEQDPYLWEIQQGELPVGAPIYVFFRLAGTHITDSPQLLSVNAAADLAITESLTVRITGAADSATGSVEKNAILAKARAEHVAALMEKRGVPRERIEILSEGGTATYEPVSANRNCRIELFVE